MRVCAQVGGWVCEDEGVCGCVVLCVKVCVCEGVCVSVYENV